MSNEVPARSKKSSKKQRKRKASDVVEEEAVQAQPSAVAFEDPTLASLFSSDKAVVLEPTEQLPPLPRARRLTEKDVLDGTTGDAAGADEVDEEEEASKKKKRKKKAEPTAEEQALEAEKLKRTVFVGGLPVMNKSSKLAKYFAKYGKVESVRFRSLAFAGQVNNQMRKIAYIKGEFNEKRDTCNGYVVFEDAASVEAAVAGENGRDGFQEGFVLRVDRADTPTLKPKKSVFVGNLPFEVTDKEVRGAFERYGPIEYVRVVRDANTGLGRGFAYVCFERREHAAAECQRCFALGEPSNEVIAHKNTAASSEDAVKVGERRVRVERCADKGDSTLGRAKFKPQMKNKKRAGPKPGKDEGNNKKRPFHGQSVGGSKSGASNPKKGPNARAAEKRRKNKAREPGRAPATQ